MPELPEVETVVRGLKTLLSGQPRLVKVELRRPDLRDPIPLRELRSLEGEALLDVRRRAKYILLETAKGTLLSHLGMTGSWRWQPKADFLQTHDHVLLHFEKGVLIYRDPRRFGVLDYLGRGQEMVHPRLKDLGPEPLELENLGSYLWEKARGRAAPVKSFLMSNDVIVGVGNIYANEALWSAGVSPFVAAQRVSARKFADLGAEIQRILNEAIALGGSSINDYVDADGNRGGFQMKFRVYDRKGEKCVACGRQIRAKMLAGRSTFSCPGCQAR